MTAVERARQRAKARAAEAEAKAKAAAEALAAAQAEAAAAMAEAEALAEAEEEEAADVSDAPTIALRRSRRHRGLAAVNAGGSRIVVVPLPQMPHTAVHGRHAWDSRAWQWSDGIQGTKARQLQQQRHRDVHFTLSASGRTECFARRSQCGGRGRRGRPRLPKMQGAIRRLQLVWHAVRVRRVGVPSNTGCQE